MHVGFENAIISRASVNYQSAEFGEKFSPPEWSRQEVSFLYPFHTTHKRAAKNEKIGTKLTRTCCGISYSRG